MHGLATFCHFWSSSSLHPLLIVSDSKSEIILIKTFKNVCSVLQSKCCVPGKNWSNILITHAQVFLDRKTSLNGKSVSVHVYQHTIWLLSTRRDATERSWSVHSGIAQWRLLV